jgi:citronellol/citronellal dehydrogenase
VLVNNAGGQFIAPATSISPNGWRSVLELNLDAVFWACSAAHPYLAASGRGSVVNMVLSGVERGSMGMAHSVAARAGVVGLTRTLAQEWSRDGIRINCIGPGLVLTPNYAESGDERTLSRLVDETPLRRATDVTEIAELAAFLSSDAALMITGQLLQIDGGASISHGFHMIEDGGP